jgi:hypothetical protein
VPVAVSVHKLLAVTMHPRIERRGSDLLLRTRAREQLVDQLVRQKRLDLSRELRTFGRWLTARAGGYARAVGRFAAQDPRVRVRGVDGR